MTSNDDGDSLTDRTRLRISLSAIVLLAACVRLWGLSYGLPHPLARPDEEIVVGHALDLSLGGISDPEAFPYPELAYLVDPVRGRPVRPDVTWAYPYPNLVYGLDAAALFGFRMVSGWTGADASPAGFVESLVVRAPGRQYLISRAVSVICGTATVAMTYLLAFHAYRRRDVGVLAALLVAVNFLHARESHFATVDVPMTLFVTASLAMVMRAGWSRSRRDVLIAAALGGLAAAAKFNGAIVLASTGLAALRRHWTMVDRRVWRLAALLAAAAVIAFALFALTSPFSVRDYRMVHLGFRIQQRVLFGGDGPTAWPSILGVTLPGAFGWPGFAFAIAGLCRAAWRRRYPDVVLLLFIVPTFATMAGMTWILPRYPLPLVPALAVLAAETGLTLFGRLRRLSVAVMVAMLAVPPLVGLAAYDRLAALPDTRQIAAEWIASHVPPNSRIAVCRGYGAPIINADPRLGPSFDRAWVACDLAAIQASNAHYLVTHTHPYVDFFRPSDEARGWVEERARRLVTLTPFRGAANLERCFFAGDAFYLPYCRFGEVERGGPEITVWELPPLR